MVERLLTLLPLRRERHRNIVQPRFASPALCCRSPMRLLSTTPQSHCNTIQQKMCRHKFEIGNLVHPRLIHPLKEQMHKHVGGLTCKVVVTETWECYVDEARVSQLLQLLHAQVATYSVENDRGSKPKTCATFPVRRSELKPDEIFMPPRCDPKTALHAINVAYTEINTPCVWDKVTEFHDRNRLAFCKKCFDCHVADGDDCQSTHPANASSWNGKHCMVFRGVHNVNCELNFVTVHSKNISRSQSTKRLMAHALNFECPCLFRDNPGRSSTA